MKATLSRSTRHAPERVSARDGLEVSGRRRSVRKPVPHAGAPWSLAEWRSDVECPSPSPPQQRRMPRYELALILKAMQRPEAAAALRRTMETLLERGAVVRDLENLGERRLPYKVSKHNQRHTHGGYYLVDFHASPSVVKGFLNHLERDVDVIRPTILKKDTEGSLGSQGSQAQCCGPTPAQTSKRPSA